jgi:hypothetical protein
VCFSVPNVSRRLLECDPFRYLVTARQGVVFLDILPTVRTMVLGVPTVNGHRLDGRISRELTCAQVLQGLLCMYVRGRLLRRVAFCCMGQLTRHCRLRVPFTSCWHTQSADLPWWCSSQAKWGRPFRGTLCILQFPGGAVRGWSADAPTLGLFFGRNLLKLDPPCSAGKTAIKGLLLLAVGPAD